MNFPKALLFLALCAGSYAQTTVPDTPNNFYWNREPTGRKTALVKRSIADGRPIYRTTEITCIEAEYAGRRFVVLNDLDEYEVPFPYSSSPQSCRFLDEMMRRGDIEEELSNEEESTRASRPVATPGRNY